MTPIHLNTLLIPPGTKLWDSNEAKPSKDKNEVLLSHDSYLDELNNAFALYLPDSEIQPPESMGELEVEDNGDIPELHIKEGFTTQTLFVITGGQDNADINTGFHTRGSWAIEYMGETQYVDIKANIKAIYEDALFFAEGKHKTPNFEIFTIDPGSNYNPETKKPYPIDFLTRWEVETSRDWESQIDEIEAFHYKGPGRTTAQ